MKKAFTLAEVVITLGIIGVVATICLPTLISNISDVKYRIVRKRVLNNIGEATQIAALNGELTVAKDAEDFVENYLRKYLKIIATCSNDKLNECGLKTEPNSISIYNVAQKRTMPTKMSELNTASSNTIDPNLKSYGFIMANGYSINLFYNPKCLEYGMTTPNNKYGFNNWLNDFVCINAIYDMNG